MDVFLNSAQSMLLVKGRHDTKFLDRGARIIVNARLVFSSEVIKLDSSGHLKHLG
jgi:diphthamide biosynthesis methyltransferase